MFPLARKAIEVFTRTLAECPESSQKRSIKVGEKKNLMVLSDEKKIGEIGGTNVFGLVSPTLAK